MRYTELDGLKPGTFQELQAPTGLNALKEAIIDYETVFADLIAPMTGALIAFNTALLELVPQHVLVNGYPKSVKLTGQKRITDNSTSVEIFEQRWNPKPDAVGGNSLDGLYALVISTQRQGHVTIFGNSWEPVESDAYGQIVRYRMLGVDYYSYFDVLWGGLGNTRGTNNDFPARPQRTVGIAKDIIEIGTSMLEWKYCRIDDLQNKKLWSRGPSQ